MPFLYTNTNEIKTCSQKKKYTNVKSNSMHNSQKKGNKPNVFQQAEWIKKQCCTSTVVDCSVVSRNELFIKHLHGGKLVSKEHALRPNYRDGNHCRGLVREALQIGETAPGWTGAVPHHVLMCSELSTQWVSQNMGRLLTLLAGTQPSGTKLPIL